MAETTHGKVPLDFWLVNTGKRAADGSANNIRQLSEELLLSAQAGRRLIGHKRFLASVPFFIPNSETFASTETTGAPSRTKACQPRITETTRSLSSPPNKLSPGETLSPASLAPEHTHR